jgi:exodeoxyribonuclease VII small subunit
MVQKKTDYRTLSEELETLLARLHGSDIQVDEAMKLYEQGVILIKQLEEHLERAENELVTLKVHASTNNSNG